MNTCVALQAYFLDELMNKNTCNTTCFKKQELAKH